MIEPTQIMPSHFGLKWGMARNACLLALQPYFPKESLYDLMISTLLNEQLSKVWFEIPDEGLVQIQVAMHQSEGIWDDEPEPYEKLELDIAQYQAYYTSLVTAYTKLLGAPISEEPDENVSLNGWVEMLAYWNLAEGKFMVAYEYQTKEIPIRVWIATIR